MRRLWVNKARSFKDAERFDRDYYLNMDPGTRLETMQLLRETYAGFRRGTRREGGRGLRRAVRIVQ